MMRIADALNGGILTDEFYPLAEQVAGETDPDVLALRSQPRESGPCGETSNSLVAVADAPPKVSISATADEQELYAWKQWRLVIRHSSGDDVVAFVEIVSPGNKSECRPLERFVDKAASAVLDGIHLLIINLLPPGRHDPRGIHAAFWDEFGKVPCEPPAAKPLTLASYEAGPMLRAWVEPIAVGDVLPDMPLFLDAGYYVSVPLESTYQEAYRSVPHRWRRIIEAADDS